MAQNITLLGASYSDVPAVELPKTGGGTASFTDVTDTTATASDVASGKYFYDASGTRTQGTSSGGGGYDLLDIVKRTEPSGDVVLDSNSNFNVRTYFFQNYTGITSFSSNKASQLHGYAFQNCSNMTSVNCPNCTKLEMSVFEGCSKLASITLSNNYSVANNCFRTCTSLQDFECWASGTATTMFYGDTSLRFVDFKNLNLYRFEANCFQNCSALKTLVLRKTSSVVGLANVSAFSGTPFANGGSGGTIYIPKVLYDHLGDNSAYDYQHATNWSTVQGYGTITWAKIEGSIYE